jgi:hypothetical protein
MAWVVSLRAAAFKQAGYQGGSSRFCAQSLTVSDAACVCLMFLPLPL